MQPAEIRWQRNMSQMKEQDKTLKEQISEVEIGDLLEKGFRVIIVKSIQDLGKRMEDRLRRYKNCLTKT